MKISIIEEPQGFSRLSEEEQEKEYRKFATLAKVVFGETVAITKAQSKVAQGLLQGGMGVLATAVNTQINELLKRCEEKSQLGNNFTKSTEDIHRKQALIGIRLSIFRLRRNLNWVWARQAYDIYNALKVLASPNTCWTTKGLQQVQDALNRFCSEIKDGEEK